MEFQQQLNQFVLNDESLNTVFTSLNQTVGKKLPQIRQRVKENSRLLPTQAIDIMTEWYDRHYDNPYPTYRDCELLAQRGQITVNQVKQWFVNVRRRTQNQFRKTRDVNKSNKRKSKNENEETEDFKRVKTENVEKYQYTDSYSTVYSNSSAEISYPSQTNSPVGYNFVNSVNQSPEVNYSNQVYTPENLSPVTSSSPVSNYQGYYNQYNYQYNYFNNPSYVYSSNTPVSPVSVNNYAYPTQQTYPQYNAYQNFNYQYY